MRKILAVLRDSDADGARSLAERIDQYDDKRPARPSPPAALEGAVLERRVVTVRYASRNGHVSQRTVEPLAVVGDAPYWYLWAWCRLREAPRSFRIDRIRDAVTHDELAPDRDLDIDDYFPVTDRSILDDS